MMRAFRFLGWTVGYALIVLLVVSATALTAARWLLPQAHQYTQHIEKLLSTTLQTPVRIGRLDASWDRFGPRLIVKDVRILDSVGEQEIGRFAVAHLNFDLGSLLTHGRLGLSGVSVWGVHLVIEHLPEGNLRIAGLGHVVTDAPVDTASAAQWLFGQLQWQINDSSVDWRDLRADAVTLHFTHVNVRLRNQAQHHRLEGSMSLPSDLGEQVAFSMDATGDPLRPQTWTGQSYFGGKHINLAGAAQQWSDAVSVPIKTGTADVQLWGHWDHGLGQLTGEIAGRNVALATFNDQSTTFEQLETQLRWRRRDAGWDLSLNRLVVNRDGRTWPDARAQIRYDHSDPTTAAAFETQFSFLRVDDVAAVSVALPQLEGSWREF